MSRPSHLGKEIRSNSEYNTDKWGFLAKVAGRMDEKLLRGNVKDRRSLTNLT